MSNSVSTKNVKILFIPTTKYNKREQKAICINTYTAQSGCLDLYIRRRTHKAAISLGKLLRSVIAQDFRMGEPYLPRQIIQYGWTPAELKYLSKQGKEINRDSESSDERNWNSPNLYGAKDEPVAVKGLHDVSSQCSRSDTHQRIQKNSLERLTIEGNSPVFEIYLCQGAIHS